MNKLPDKLSELLRVAVADMRKVQDDPRYVLYAWDWHEPRDLYCSVCMAGAVMAGTLGADHREELGTESFDSDTRNKLAALNEARCGHLRTAYSHLGGVPARIDDVEHAARVIQASYDDADTGFASLEAYEQAANILEKADL